MICTNHSHFCTWRSKRILWFSFRTVCCKKNGKLYIYIYIYTHTHTHTHTPPHTHTHTSKDLHLLDCQAFTAGVFYDSFFFRFWRLVGSLVEISFWGIFSSIFRVEGIPSSGSYSVNPEDGIESSSETLVSTYKPIWCQGSEHCHLTSILHFKHFST